MDGSARDADTVPWVRGVAAWKTLSTQFVGRWISKEEGVVVDYRLSARGSVLLETWMPGTEAESVSAYHLDKDRLIMTHYCGQGNQPRLVLVDAGPNRLVFKRFDVTGQSPREGVLSDLVLSLDGLQHARAEHYVRDDESQVATIEFVKARDYAAGTL